MKKLNFIPTMLLVFASSPAMADKAAKTEPVRYFTPGTYKLIEGETKLCGEGDFHLSKDGDRIWLGPYYSFKTTPGTETGDGGFPTDKGCVYTAVSDVKVKGKQTLLTNVSTQQCGKIKRQVVTNSATVSKNRITLEQSTVVDPDSYNQAGGSPHQCAWRHVK